MNSLLVYLGIKQPFLMSSGSQGSGRTAVTSSSLASDFTHLPHTEGPREWGATRPRLHFHEGADSDATHISLHGVSLSVTSAPRSHVGSVENSCLYIGAFLGKKKKKKRQEVRSSPWPQLPSRVLPSGSYDDPFHSLLIL